MNDEQNWLDDRIDQALASYTPLEPRPGLEQRILATVASAGRPRSWSWKPLWALAATAAVVAVVAIPFALKPTRPNLAALPAITTAAHLPQAVPAAAKTTRPTFTRPFRPAGPRRELPANLGQSSPGHLAPATFAEPLAISPIRNQPLTAEALELKPITIDRIQIAALN
jgi:hypothetical protein